jgi:hypothetical protein
MIRLFEYDDSGVAFLIRAFEEVGEKRYILKSAAFIEIPMRYPIYSMHKLKLENLRLHFP